MNNRTVKEWIKNRRILLSCIAILLLIYYFSLPRTLFDSSYSTVVNDRQGELLGARIADDGQWRFPPSDSIPEKFSICLRQFEDRYFYYHWGINPASMIRATWQNIRSGKVISGGSTLTMQTIRLSRNNKKRNFWEKMVEMILATRLEFRYSKKEILNLYASHAPFGGNVVGLEAASWRYFGHSSGRLSWAEAATLAILPNAPSMLHLSKNRKALLEKRNRLLKKLLDKGEIDLSTYELAISEVLPSEPLPLPQCAPHLVTYFYKTEKSRSITSTIDKGIQLQVENLLERWHEEFNRSDIRNLAAVVIDVKKNQVLAYCGNIRFDSGLSANQVDIIRSPRSTGSILKPFLYYAMLQEGQILPHTLLPDIPINVNGFSPLNFNKQFDGAVPASEAIARSLNVPSVQMLRSYGVPKFHDLLKKIGLTTLNKPSYHYGLSLILGGAEGTLWDISAGYASMAKTLNAVLENRKDLKICGLAPGLVLNEKIGDEKNEGVFHAGAVWQVFDAIKEVNRPEEIDWRVIPSMQKVAWKTGTSYGFRDAWAVGVTPKYVVGVWVGNADGEGKPGLTGAKTAGPVLFDIFNLLPSSAWFDIPYSEFVEAEVCHQSGCLKSRFCDDPDTLLICPQGMKTAACPYHIPVNLSQDERYRVYESCVPAGEIIKRNWFVLPPAWEWYYRQHHSDYKPLPPFKPGCGDGNSSPMQFIYPQQNAKITLPKQIDGSRGSVVFELAHTNPDAVVYWHLDQEYIASTRYIHQLAIKPVSGRHSITVVDNEGNSLSIGVEVE